MAILATVADAGRMSIAVGVSIDGRAHVLAEGELDIDWLAHLGGKRMANQIEIAIGHPIAKKPVRRLDGCHAVIHRDKTERSDPRLIADLPQRIAHAVGGLLPNFVHSFTPCSPRTLAPPVRNRKSLF